MASWLDGDNIELCQGEALEIKQILEIINKKSVADALDTLKKAKKAVLKCTQLHEKYEE